MATGDLVRSSDGELSLKVGVWAEEKIDYIQRYCEIFNTGMKYHWRTRAYIDLFAGPGKCYIEEMNREIDGSPIVALRCKEPFTHYFFNDADPQVISSLKKRVESFNRSNVFYFTQDCNTVIDQLRNKLPSASLDFCFVDPFSFEVKFDSIRRLTEGRRMDLAITFHVGSMKRIAHNPPKELLEFFPDASWLKMYEEERFHKKGHILLSAFEKGLEKIGYQDVRDYVLVRNQKGVPLYHIIFATKNPGGRIFGIKLQAAREQGN